jgi:hypothetical protein
MYQPKFQPLDALMGWRCGLKSSLPVKPIKKQGTKEKELQGREKRVPKHPRHFHYE